MAVGLPAYLHCYNLYLIYYILKLTTLIIIDIIGSILKTGYISFFLSFSPAKLSSTLTLNCWQVVMMNETITSMAMNLCDYALHTLNLLSAVKRSFLFFAYAKSSMNCWHDCRLVSGAMLVCIPVPPTAGRGSVDTPLTSAPRRSWSRLSQWFYCSTT